jgi:hypothetical protein
LLLGFLQKPDFIRNQNFFFLQKTSFEISEFVRNFGISVPTEIFLLPEGKTLAGGLSAGWRGTAAELRLL